MIQNLLTALGVAALSIQTPNNNTHEEPKRAYYDSSAVAEYGTETGYLYNYTDEDLYNNVEALQVAKDEGETYAVLTGSTSITCGNNVNAANFITTAESLDLYVDGNFSATLSPSTTYNDKNLFVIMGRTYDVTTTDHYIWLFDHYTPAPMSQTIIETAGDATTAAAAVVGAGFTGVVSLFYNDGITGLGILSLIMAGVALVWFALSLVMKLWRRR